MAMAPPPSWCSQALNGQGALVSVSYAPAVFTDTNGGTYVETGSALGGFNTQTAPGHTYTVALQLKFKGQNGAPSFSVLTDRVVTVGQNQAPANPAGLGAPGLSTKCGL
jgi:hypothetical protein